MKMENWFDPICDTFWSVQFQHCISIISSSFFNWFYAGNYLSIQYIRMYIVFFYSMGERERQRYGIEWKIKIRWKENDKKLNSSERDSECVGVCLYEFDLM